MKTSLIGIKSILMVVLVLTFLIPINIFAESPFYIALKPGIYSPQSIDPEVLGEDVDLDFETGFSGEIAFGCRFSPNVAAELGIGYSNTDGEETFVAPPYVGRGEFNFDVYPVFFTLKPILPYKKWEFFGLLGAGVYFVSGDFKANISGFPGTSHLEDHDAIFGVHLGAGIHYNITPKIFVGVEGKYLWTDEVKLKDKAYGIPLEAKFKMDGVIATAVFGIRF